MSTSTVRRAPARGIRSPWRSLRSHLTIPIVVACAAAFPVVSTAASLSFIGSIGLMLQVP